jgi:adhesin/invasin
VSGKVFVGTKTQLVAYGLFPTLSVTGGNGQTGQVATPLPVSLTVKAANPYSGNPIAGVTVTFSDAGKGGSFNSASAVTDSTGTATTIYTLPQKTGSFIITASSAGYAPTSFNLSAVAGPPTKLGLSSGGAQTATVGTTLPSPVVVQLNDAYNNRVPGVAVTFSDGGAFGTFSPTTPVNTDVMGLASVNYTLPTRVSSVTITATAASLSLHVSEKATAGPPQTMAYISGNKQTASTNTLLPVALAVAVRDQYGNPISGVTVTFSDGGAGGTLSSATAVTGNNGKASVTYTTPPNVGKVTITASSPPLTPVLFNESVVP